MRRTGYMLLLASLACLGLGALAGSAGAAPGVESSSLSLSSNQAGSHADLTASLSLKEPGEPETAKDLVVGLPPGYFLFPDLFPHCVASLWAEGECPVDSQVGLVTVRGNFESDPDFVLGTAPVYLLAPEPGQIAYLGFVVPTIEAPVTAPVTTAPGNDYGLNLALEGLPEAAPTQSLTLTLWGIPPASVHDEERFPGPAGCPGSLSADCTPPGGLASSLPLIPFARNPTFCGPQAGLALEADSYQDPGDFATASSPAPMPGGCGKPGFSPKLTVDLSGAETSAPSGLNLAVGIPGDLAPSGLSSSDLKDLVVSLPPQLGLDEGALAGSATCSIAQAHLEGNGADECPAGSKIGSSAVAVLGVEPPLEGNLYFGGAASPDSYRLFFIAAGAGIDLRLQALLEYDEARESWEIAFANLPQLPFETLEMEVASTAGPFVNPWKCGSFEVAGVLTPWSDRPPGVVITDLIVDSGPGGGPCPGPAEEVTVSLSPSSIFADGTSHSVATATVLDANGYLLVGEEVAFESTDAGQRIGPVTESGEGTYTARITASTKPGTARIFAFDESVGGEAFGFAELTQLALPRALAGAPAAKPRVKFRRRPPAKTRDRTPTFRFVSTVAGSTFECKLDRRPLRRCKSPLTLPRLGFDGHTFKVRAVAPGGAKSRFSTYSFVVYQPATRRP